MYTKQALRQLGVTGKELSEGQLRQLDEHGFIIIENYYSKPEARARSATTPTSFRTPDTGRCSITRRSS